MNIDRVSVAPEAIEQFCREHHLRELSIFGSVLRSDFRADSDIDVLIELEPDQTMTIERFMLMRDELEAMLGRPIDLVEKPLLRNPFRRREILRTRKVLYAA